VIEQECSSRTPVKPRDVQLPVDDLLIDIDGWKLLAKHPTILFGDDESAKSMLAFYIAGRLAQLGKRVLTHSAGRDTSNHPRAIY
jgi:hypothetical protein